MNLMLLPLMALVFSAEAGILYPQESESRELRSLDGLWDFRISPVWDQNVGFRDSWFKRRLGETGDVIQMPVPSSYNDVTQNKTLRDYVGWAWYDREFYVPERWQHQKTRIWLRFGSVHYKALVWVNGHYTTSHEMGHLPFQCDVTGSLRFGAKNRVTVAVDNTLSAYTIPQGQVVEIGGYRYSTPRLRQTYTFDFFNYAGIHRPVLLFTTPSVYIDDVTVTTDIDGTTGYIRYQITYKDVTNPSRVPPLCHVSLLNKEDENVISDQKGLEGIMEIPDAKFWWPYLMHPEPGYLYTLEVRLFSAITNEEDTFRLPVGIRKVEWTDKSFFINKKPFYFRGFGKHEDSDIRGKGFDYPLAIKDYNLIKWIGGNSYRTTHYPYAEEIMDLADQEGIVIIDECPSVNTENYTNNLLKLHQKAMKELIDRDKNRPSVVMWSIANEPRSHLHEANAYFKSVVNYTKSIDPDTRPITIAISRYPQEDKAAKHLDVICFNRYQGWYTNTGQTDVIQELVELEAEEWHTKFQKPIIMSEYGADTMAGLHISPDFIWSEEYQVKLMSEHFKAFDTMREKGFFIGEMIWNFADFKTDQSITRVGGNRKGIFTRQRQPKASAHLLRKRNMELARILDGNNVTAEYEIYTSPITAQEHQEL